MSISPLSKPTPLALPNLTAFLADDLLGECPHWDEERGILSRVDVHGGLLRCCDPATGEQSTVTLEAPISFAIPRTSGGYVFGIGLQVILLDADGTKRSLVDLSAQRPDNRLNDAVCDAQGRLWVGTMSSMRPRAAGAAALYRIDPDGGYEEVLTDLTLSNGMDWPDDGATLLHIDSDAHRIDRHEVDVQHGRLGRRSCFAELDPADGLPDGLTIDAEGGVWVAFFGGSEIRRYDAQGGEVARLRLPVSCPASVAFGGADLGDLFITTSRHRLTEAETAQQPLAGSLLRLRPGVKGRIGYRFAG